MLDGRYRFDNYVVGAANRLAASAARAIAEAPGSVYNPLFIYSSSGLGKTHLLAALGHEARQLHPRLAIEYLTLDDFVESLHQAVASGQADAFKRRYQDVDLLLLDDVQFLTGRAETQTEILRVFNALQAKGRQIVMACDRPPSEISDVDARLLSRLSGGLIVDIGAPDFETRVAILRHKCEERGARFAAGVLEELARMPARNVRELQGALNRLLAHQSILDVPLTVADVRHVLGIVQEEEPQAADEFQSFVDDLALTVAQSMEEWRVRLAESIARWSAEGYDTGTLERLLEAGEPPELDAIEEAFAATAERLRAIETEAIRLDPMLAGSPVFRDPERLHEAEVLLARAVARSDPPPAPQPGMHMHDLVRSSGNRLAIEAAMAVVDTPGTRYSPLFVHGAQGTGKSHLAHAIGNALRARGSGGWTVACVGGDAFVEELIAALHSGSVERWRARYRAVDALIVDDVQALADKERTQEEFFHLFNILQQSGRQIVLTSDCPLGRLTGLQPRLRSRFEGGLVVEMGIAKGIDRPSGNTPEGTEAAEPTIDAMVDEALSDTPDEDRADFGVLAEARQSLDSFFFDMEKVVGEWPDHEGRVIEEAR